MQVLIIIKPLEDTKDTKNKNISVIDSLLTKGKSNEN